MKKSALILVTVLGFAALSCTKEVAEDLTPYNDAVSQINSDLNNLSTIITTLQKDGYVNTVSSLSGSSVLSLSDGATVSVKEAASGEIATPLISVISSEGSYYWTVNGTVAADGGSDVMVTSVAPAISYSDKQWSISFGGSNQAQVIEASSSNYSGVFKGLQTGDQTVTVSLVDGQTLELPYKANFSLKLSVQDVACFPGTSVTVPYTIYGASSPEITCTASGAYTATVKKETAVTGTVCITAGSDNGEGSVKLSATNGIKTVEKDITVCKGCLVVVDVYSVEATGGKLDIDVETNLDYTVKSDASWITVDQTKVEMRKETISVTVDENVPGDPERTGEIKFCSVEDETVLQTVSVTQKAARIEVDYVYASYDAQTLEASASGATSDCDWLTVEEDGKITLTENAGIARKATLKCGGRNLCVIQNPGTAFLDLSFENAEGDLETKNTTVVNVGTASKLSNNPTKAFTAFQCKEKNYSKPVTIMQDDTLGHKIALFHNEQCPSSYGSILFARANQENVEAMWNGFSIESVFTFNVALWNECGGKKNDEANAFCYKATTTDAGTKALSLGIIGDESGYPVISAVLNGTRYNTEFALEADKYYHVVVTCDKATQKVTFYVNGTDIAQKDETRALSEIVPFGSSSPWWGGISNNLPNAWVIGGYLNGQWQVPNINWCGRVATMRIYASTLTSDEVAGSYEVMSAPYADLY